MTNSDDPNHSDGQRPVVPEDDQSPPSSHCPQLPEGPSRQRLQVGQIVRASSHRINNLLHRISGGEYLIDGGLQAGDMAKVQRTWNIVKLSQNRLSHLLSRLVTISQGPAATTLLPHPVNKLLRQALEDAAAAFELIYLVQREQVADDVRVTADWATASQSVLGLITIGYLVTEMHDDESNWHVSIGTSANDDTVSVAVGFRPVGRSFDFTSFSAGIINGANANCGLLELLAIQNSSDSQNSSVEFDQSDDGYCTITLCLDRASDA